MNCYNRIINIASYIKACIISIDTFHNNHLDNYLFNDIMEVHSTEESHIEPTMETSNVEPTMEPPNIEPAIETLTTLRQRLKNIKPDDIDGIENKSNNFNSVDKQKERYEADMNLLHPENKLIEQGLKQ